MIPTLLKKVFGSRNERLLKRYTHTVRAINALEPQIEAFSDAALRAKTDEFRSSPREGETLDQLLPEAFAVVREAGKRALEHAPLRRAADRRHGAARGQDRRDAHRRRQDAGGDLAGLSERACGEGVHVVTVNDYLASRDAAWMGRIYSALGLSVGVNLSQMDHAAKQQAYAADITYGTNNEFGFDYLRDNMVYETSAARAAARCHSRIVDEVDSILIDEARTPLIISGQAEDVTELYYRINDLVPKLMRQKEENGPGDFSVDEKAHQVLLSEAGHERAEELLTRAGLLAEGTSLYDAVEHHSDAPPVRGAARPLAVSTAISTTWSTTSEVVIVDEFTGRLMPGRRWSDGLHQAVEAKEGVRIQRENQTLASITFQNYFRMYKKLAGMTGTADTEAYEFQQIYNLETVVIPTHMAMIREDRMDQVFKTKREKIQARHRRHQGLPRARAAGAGRHDLDRELRGAIQAPARREAAAPSARTPSSTRARRRSSHRPVGPKMVTIATNMAGRGTDIVLGGNPDPEINRVRADESLSEEDKTRPRCGDPHALAGFAQPGRGCTGGCTSWAPNGTSRGGSTTSCAAAPGRQGDPGSSRFYLSLEDPLLRIFASDRVAAIMDRLKMPEGEAIEHPWVTRAIENAQRKVEARNFDIRKQLLEYDDVANDQRR